MEKRNINKVTLAVIAVALIIAIVGGSTYAYWTWQTASGQRTNVNVTVAEGISMVITPTTVSTNKLHPTNNCAGDATIVSTALIEIDNQTGILARPKFYLKLQILNSAGTNITSTYAQYIHYAVAETDGSCTSPIASGIFTNQQTTNVNNDGAAVTGWYNSPIITNLNGTFPKITSEDAASVSFDAPAYNGGTMGNVSGNKATHTYKVWAWLGNEYAATNTGDTVSDPLQDATIKVSWSETSEVIQVTG